MLAREETRSTGESSLSEVRGKTGSRSCEEVRGKTGSRGSDDTAGRFILGLIFWGFLMFSVGAFLVVENEAP